MLGVPECPLTRFSARHHDVIMRTTVNINDALLRDLRQQAAAAGRPFREVLEEAIAVGLARQATARTARRYRVRPHALHLKEAYRKLSLNQVFDQLDAEMDSR